MNTKARSIVSILGCGVLAMALGLGLYQLRVYRDREYLNDIASESTRIDKAVQAATYTRDQILNDIRDLRRQKRQLEAAEEPMPGGVTNVVTLTNVVTTVEVAFDGRVAALLRTRERLHTDKVWPLPYSPHEFVALASNRVWYVWDLGESTNYQVLSIFDIK